MTSKEMMRAVDEANYWATLPVGTQYDATRLFQFCRNDLPVILKMIEGMEDLALIEMAKEAT